MKPLTNINQLPNKPELTSQIRVYYYDTDAGGVVHNIAYLRFIEEARTKLAEHLGWPLEEMAKGEIVPVVAKTEIIYIKPAKLADYLNIHSRLTKLGGASFDIAFEITRPVDNTIIARSRQTLACITLPAGRPIRIPLPWREKWPALENPASI